MDPDRLILLASAIATFLLAALVLLQGPGRGLHRAFAAVLAARATTLLLPQLSSDVAWTRAALATQPYFVLALAPLGLFALTTLDLPAGTTRTRIGWAALAAIVVLDGAYALDHALFQTVAPGEAPVGALRAGPGLAFTGFGPLAAVGSLWSLALGALALRFAVRYRELARTRSARAWLLMAAGFTVGALFDGANRLSALASLLDDPARAAFPWLPWGWAVVALPLAALPLAALAVAVLAANRSVDPRPHSQLEGVVLVLAAFATATGLLRLMLPGDSDIAGHPLTLLLMGLWRLSLPVFLAWGLLEARAALAAPASDVDAAGAIA